jgi:RND family efflux transporter MFP subunit
MTAMRYPVLAVAGLALALSAVACSKPEPARPAPAAAVPVTVVTTATEDLADVIETGGVVRARVTATIVSRIMAEVQAISAVPGQRVSAGQTLVRLDARDLQANQLRAVAAQASARHGMALAEADLQAADAALALAKVTHQRFTDLRARNSATQQELDEATAGLRAAESRRRAAEARIAEATAGIDAAAAAATSAAVALSYATLQAPFDGVVTEKHIEPGNMASPGQPLLTVEDTRSFRLEVRLDESRAALVQPGTAVAVGLDSASAPQGGGTTVNGRVAEISRVLSPGSYDFLVKIDLPAGSAGLRSGMYGRALLTSNPHRGIAVPSTSVIRRGQLAFVYVVDADGTAHLRMVNAGDPLGGRMEIRAGLVAGERVVVAPPDTLVDGSKVVATAAVPDAGAARQPEARQ